MQWTCSSRTAIEGKTIGSCPLGCFPASPRALAKTFRRPPRSWGTWSAMQGTIPTWPAEKSSTLVKDGVVHTSVLPQSSSINKHQATNPFHAHHLNPSNSSLHDNNHAPPPNPSRAVLPSSILNSTLSALSRSPKSPCPRVSLHRLRRLPAIRLRNPRTLWHSQSNSYRWGQLHWSSRVVWQDPRFG